MDKVKVERARDIAKEFIERCDKVLESKGWETSASSALKRQSMELTRELAVLRNPNKD